MIPLYLVMLAHVFSPLPSSPWEAYEYLKDKSVGTKHEVFDKPFKFKDLGGYVYRKEYDNYCKLSKETDGYGKYYLEYCVSENEGLTHITKDKNGNIIYHWFSGRYLREDSTAYGDCKIYYVVDSQTHIILSWHYDIENGGNPESCTIGS